MFSNVKRIFMVDHGERVSGGCGAVETFGAHLHSAFDGSTLDPAMLDPAMLGARTMGVRPPGTEIARDIADAGKPD
jgi:hypothetical protein